MNNEEELMRHSIREESIYFANRDSLPSHLRGKSGNGLKERGGHGYLFKG